MSRLTKFIESLQKDVKIKESKTTASQYFELGSVKIRVSDHFSNTNESHIQIINPINSGTLYLVQIKEGMQILSFSFSEVKTFIQNNLWISNIKKSNSDVKKEVRKAVKQSKVITDDLDSGAYRLANYCKLSPNISKAIGLKTKKLNNKKKKIYREVLVGADIPYDKMVAIGKLAVQQQIFTHVADFIEKWILTEINK
jgi:hypothetical protein